jgi:hypothetical protein
MKIIEIDESSSESSATMKKVPEKDGIEGLVQEMKLFRQSVDESMQQLQIKMEKFGLMVETSYESLSSICCTRGYKILENFCSVPI